mmetsp:Transcript_5009/g.17460  ORF Transcript_5009/g.17460 Transcript_5009/m.17460 type:complete len:233 (+) Transcript_5009:132-830(+)
MPEVGGGDRRAVSPSQVSTSEEDDGSTAKPADLAAEDAKALREARKGSKELSQYWQEGKEGQVGKWKGVSLGGDSRVVGLDLNSATLDNIPIPFFRLAALQRLSLSGSYISVVPPAVASLTNLTFLSLYINYLAELPKEIGALKNLQKLDVSRNQLQDLPPEIGGLQSLTSLDVSKNALRTVPYELGDLKRLRKLDLRGNRRLGQLPVPVSSLARSQGTEILGAPSACCSLM